MKLTIRENRTGFYLRVLEQGKLQAGDSWTVEERLNQDASIPAINRCLYLDFNLEYARRMLEMRGLESWFKEQAHEKIARPASHWTETMAGDAPQP